jgi:uncharacterized protein (TIGR00645 family)
MSKSQPKVKGEYSAIKPLPLFIFASRWLQLPLYLGLIVAQGVYVWLFMEELIHLVQILWKPELINAIAGEVIKAGGEAVKISRNKETVVMLIVLGLIDVVMISNLLIMVIVGGYETFVSRMGLESHPDQPEWLSHVNANVLKVKLAAAIIGISSIHLLKTFINAEHLESKTMLWQTVIHLTFIISAVAIASLDRIMNPQSKVH